MVSASQLPHKSSIYCLLVLIKTIRQRKEEKYQWLDDKARRDHFTAHNILYHANLGSRVIKDKKDDKSMAPISLCIGAIGLPRKS